MASNIQPRPSWLKIHWIWLKKTKKVIKGCDIISIVVVAYPEFKFTGIRRALWNVVHAGFGGSAKRLTLQIMPAKR